MKVVQVSTYDRGGAFQAAYRLHLALLEKGVDSKVLVLYQYNSGLKEVYSFLKTGNLLQKIKRSFLYRYFELLRYFLLPKDSNSQFNFHFSPYTIWEHPIVANADIVHLHWVANFIDYFSFFSAPSKPVVWTLHDLHPFSGGFHYEIYSTFAGSRFLTLNNWVETRKIKSLELFENLSIVSPSKWLSELSVRSKVFSRFNHFVIPNGVDSRTFRPKSKIESRRELNLDQNKKIILFLAESLNDPRKGVDDFYKVLKLCSSLDFLLLTVGNGHLEFDAMENHSIGFVEDEEMMASIYSASDLFITCSLEDNFPNTVLESVSCGTPVLGYAVGGIFEIVENGRNGFLVEKGDVTVLANKMMEVLLDDFLLNDLQNKTRNSVRGFASDLQAEKMIELYNRIS